MTDRESPIQVAIVRWLEARFPAWIVHHCRNEINMKGRDIARQLAHAKWKGAKAGFPDLLCLIPGGASVYFEVKAEGNYATDSQKEMHKRMHELSHKVAVVRSVDDVAEKLAEWGIA